MMLHNFRKFSDKTQENKMRRESEIPRSGWPEFHDEYTSFSDDSEEKENEIELEDTEDGKSNVSVYEEVKKATWKRKWRRKRRKGTPKGGASSSSDDSRAGFGVRPVLDDKFILDVKSFPLGFSFTM